MKSIISYTAILFSIIWGSTSFAQDLEEYDQYDCVIQKVMNSCANKTTGITLDSKWQKLSEQGKKDGDFLKDFLKRREQEIIDGQDGTFTTTTHFLISCSDKITEENFSLGKNEKLTLSYLNDHFLWEGKSIDCAWFRQEIGQMIQFNGKCPAFVVGDNNSLSQNCQDSTLTLSIGEVTFLSLGGGITLFGISFYLIKKVIKKLKKKK